MSKTSQKKFSAYQMGIDDGLLGLDVRWYAHPKMKYYMEGYREGRRARKPQKPQGMNFFERLVFAFFG